MTTPTETEALAHAVIAKLRAAGHQAYLVGGCVRDLLLGFEPKDFDVATDARPDRIMDLFPGAGLVGAQFGVVLVRDAFHQVEVATFRSDHSYEDGRHPEFVRFEDDPRQDVLRRDFTINGLMMDPVSGDVLDFAGGRADLQRRVVRAIGDPDTRFGEDHLRLLRAVRFAARLGFEIAPGTWESMQRNHALIMKVASERVRDELVRILTEGGARRGFELLDSSGMLAVVLPEVAAMKGVAQPPEYHPEGDVWTHTLMLLEQLDQPAAALALGALLHDVGKPPTFRIAGRIRFDGHVEAGVKMAHDILHRLRFSRDEMEQVEALVGNHMRFKDVHRMKDSTLKRFLRLPGFEQHLELHRLDAMSSNRNLENYELARRKRAEFSAEHLAPPPLVTGAGLIAAGYRPGPLFSKILEAVEDAQLEGRVRTSGEAMALVRELFPM
ncbi:MAG TPA: CCA tRNA nucleotidyltransferase [Candidatus Acidoferrales bacterium]|jgi:putative nucleotidyltransferase with HDIG domain|nr:CCA tRNA nucleotidyltransferase [Candidatus Acidoferrales bacterium]